jgi:hypothetical protein
LVKFLDTTLASQFLGYLGQNDTNRKKNPISVLLPKDTKASVGVESNRDITIVFAMKLYLWKYNFRAVAKQDMLSHTSKELYTSVV